MAFEEFGPAASGARLADLDYDKAQLSQLAGLAQIAGIQETMAGIPLKQAQARKTGLKADALAHEVETSKKLSALMQGGLPAGGSATNPLFALSDMAFKSGSIKMGTELLGKATQIEQRAAAAKAHQATQTLAQIRQQAAVAERLGSLAASAADQTSYDTVRAQMSADGFDVSDLPQDYREAVPHLQQLITQSMKAKDVLKAREDGIRTKSLLERRATQERVANAQLTNINARTDLTRDRQRREAKFEGEKSAASLDAKKELTELRRLKQNVEKSKGAGVSPENPSQLPFKDGKPNAAAMQTGRYYVNSQGQVGLWNGRGLEIVGRLRAPSQSTYIPPDAEDEDEDDDE